MLSKKTEEPSKINVSTSKDLWIALLLLRTGLIFATLQNKKTKQVCVSNFQLPFHQIKFSSDKVFLRSVLK